MRCGAVRCEKNALSSPLLFSLAGVAGSLAGAVPSFGSSHLKWLFFQSQLLLISEMFRLLRIVLMPISAFFIVGGLAATEWGNFFERDNLVKKFHSNSKVVFFEDVGRQEENGRSFYMYEFQEEGRTERFPTSSKIDLPSDGRVRIGQDPRPRPENPYSPIQDETRPEMVVPLRGADTVESMYDAMWGHPKQDDFVKAWVVSAAAVVTGIAAFFMQRLLFRSMRTAGKRY